MKSPIELTYNQDDSIDITADKGKIIIGSKIFEKRGKQWIEKSGRYEYNIGRKVNFIAKTPQGTETLEVNGGVVSGQGVQASQITPSELGSKMVDLSEGSIKGVSCFCGDSCNQYADSIITNPNRKNIDDPYVILAIMIHESGCKSDIGSSDKKSVGLMQVYWELHGVSESDMTIPEKAIAKGVDIFVQGNQYSTKGATKICIKKGTKTVETQTYTGKCAMLRAYNWLGCGGDLRYVENVGAIYKKITGKVFAC